MDRILELAVTVVIQLVLIVAFLTTLKNDSKVLKEKINVMGEELKKLSEVIISQALQGEQIKMIGERFKATEERQVQEGKRLDEALLRFNRYIDKVAFTKMERAATVEDR